MIVAWDVDRWGKAPDLRWTWYLTWWVKITTQFVPTRFLMINPYGLFLYIVNILNFGNICLYLWISPEKSRILIHQLVLFMNFILSITLCLELYHVLNTRTVICFNYMFIFFIMLSLSLYDTPFFSFRFTGCSYKGLFLVFLFDMYMISHGHDMSFVYLIF